MPFAFSRVPLSDPFPRLFEASRTRRLLGWRLSPHSRSAPRTRSRRSGRKYRARGMSSEERIACKSPESWPRRSPEEGCAASASPRAEQAPELSHLPFDVAARVLATLPPHTRARCSAVCRSWRNMMRELPPEQLWRELDFVRGADETFKVRRVPVLPNHRARDTTRGAFQKLSPNSEADAAMASPMRR